VRYTVRAAGSSVPRLAVVALVCRREQQRWIGHDQRVPVAASVRLSPAPLIRYVAMTRWTICNTGASSWRCEANRKRSGIGKEITHWRTGTRGSKVIDQVGGRLHHTPRPAGAKPTPFTFAPRPSVCATGHPSPSRTLGLAASDSFCRDRLRSGTTHRYCSRVPLLNDSTPFI